MDKSIFSAIIIDEDVLLDFEQFRQALSIDEPILIEMVEYQLIIPTGSTPEDWRFNSECLRRAKMGMRFYRDLEVNFSGIALVLDLLEQIDKLEKRIQLLEK